ncbi:hypothetical protein BVRB_5g106960 [Beta vulgaris subsp. vulgaris]|nr:hypothetical protein BVRB_5g106960 [Beta vulgaris subsp. vulgaris]
MEDADIIIDPLNFNAKQFFLEHSLPVPYSYNGACLWLLNVLVRVG